MILMRNRESLPSPRTAAANELLAASRKLESRQQSCEFAAQSCLSVSIHMHCFMNYFQFPGEKEAHNRPGKRLTAKEVRECIIVHAWLN